MLQDGYIFREDKFVIKISTLSVYELKFPHNIVPKLHKKDV